MTKFYFKTLIFFLLFTSITTRQFVWAGNPEGSAAGKLFSVSGYVKDSNTGEVLTGATVYVKETKKATSTNQYGFFSISLKPGAYTIVFTYVGYQNIEKFQNLLSNADLNIEMSEETKLLDEVVVKSSRPEDNIKKPEMSVARLEMKTIKQVPAFMGEVDVIKVIQMLPGVQSTSEGTSGFSVRGGGMDQNLIVLDEATVYNASHLMGFFSVFNNDAVRDVKLYKGDIPANFGGRLSSVLDVRMKEGNNKKYCVTGGVGLLSSRLTVEGPIVNEKTSFLISGRRTYYDIFFPLFPDTDLQKAKLYFYDLNLKINHEFNNNNRLYLSAYLGRDNAGQKGLMNMGFGNRTLTLRWNHLFSNQLFSNITLIQAKYNYDLSMSQGGAKYFWNSSMLDYTFKADFNFYLNPENEIKFGVSSTYHIIKPCDAWMESDSILKVPYPDNYELESGAYISNQQKIGDKLTLKYGLRATLFQNMGKTLLYKFNANHQAYDSTFYPSGKIYHSFPVGYEPRFGLSYSINEISSIKASYSHTIQYMQLASNSTSGMPLDIWFPSTPNVKPQKSDQCALGYFRNFKNNTIETSVEAYYKKMYDIVDFRDHPQLLMNRYMEGEIRTGTSQAYGIEFLVKKNDGRLNGWISYTWSRVKRKVEDINYGNAYPAPYDKPNNINIILNYELNKRMVLSANWIYATGAPYTAPVGSLALGIPTDVHGNLQDPANVNGNTYNKIYSTRNGSRMRDYHRLDVSLTLKGNTVPNRLWHGEWVFSIYNIYGRHNDWILNFSPNSDNKNITKAERWYLPFVFFPGITYNFNF
jgi:hypothetical protein